MPQIVKTSKTEIISKNGECAISISIEPIVIEINLNVDANGTVSMQQSARPTNSEPRQEIEKTDWIVPEFGNTSTFGNKKIKFGKEVKVDTQE